MLGGITIGALMVAYLSTKQAEEAPVALLHGAQTRIVDFAKWTEEELESLKTIGTGKRMLLQKANPDEMKSHRIYWFRPHLCRQEEWENERWRDKFLGELQKQDEFPICVADRGNDESRYIVWVGLQSADGLPPESAKD